MTRRIDTLRNLRRQRNYAQSRLSAGLSWHKLTLRQLRYFSALDNDLHLLTERVDRLQRMIDHYGDEWAKDDWPHAIPARAPAVGAL